MAANNSIRHSSDKGQCDNSSDGGDRPSDKVGAHPMANEIRLKPEVQVRHNECDHEYITPDIKTGRMSRVLESIMVLPFISITEFVELSARSMLITWK